MCVILNILPGGKIPDEHLFNAAANNWHSWGIGIIKPGNKLQVIKRVPEKGVHTEIKRIQTLLKKHNDCEIILHFRFNTRGETDYENAHPFLALDDEDRKVYFAHNGTFTKYGGIQNPESDSKEFVDQFLTPALTSYVTKNGYGDYQDEFFKKHILTPGWEYAGGNCRGIIFSDDLQTLRIGTWYAHDEQGHVVTNHENHRDDVRYYASNAEYFREIKRGPVYTEILAKKEQERKLVEEAREAREAEHGVTPVHKISHNGREVSPYDARKFKPDQEVFLSLCSLFRDNDLADDACLSDLGFCTIEEWDALMEYFAEKNELKSAAMFMEHVTMRFNSLYTELQKIKKITATPENKKVG